MDCLPFYPPKCPKNEKLKNKIKQSPGDVIILHKCTKNYDHMVNCSWDMVCDRCNCCFSFWAIFCPFTPLTGQKIKFSKQWKKPLEISSFYTHLPKIMIRWYTLFFILGYFLPFYPSNSPTNQNFKTMKKTLADIIILLMCTKNYD